MFTAGHRQDYDPIHHKCASHDEHWPAWPDEEGSPDHPLTATEEQVELTEANLWRVYAGLIEVRRG